MIEKYSSEVHEDGVVFIPPYNYLDFVKELGIKDSYKGFDAHVSTNGYLCFKLDDISHLTEDFGDFKKRVIEKLTSRESQSNMNNPNTLSKRKKIWK